jgi:SAM-dependent methyltransferase
MTGFAAEWLAQREPADAAARGPALAAKLGSEGPIGGAWRVVDLGSGTGANLRYLAPRLGGVQDWWLVDDDAALLARSPDRPTPRRAAGTGAEVRNVHRIRLDLAAELDAVPWPAEGLVTASALLDLVSAAWLEALARRTAAARADVLFALTYDGRIDFTPAETDDAWLRALVNRHQRGDKGFGCALGPEAAAAAARAFEAVGYRMEREVSDWRLEPAQAALQAALLDGWRAAAAEIAPGEVARLARWHARRLAHVSAGRSALRVGHIDLLGWWPRPGRQGGPGRRQ